MRNDFLRTHGDMTYTEVGYKMNHQITEGYMPFIGNQTYYRIVGEPSDKTPLLLLHGGPGSTHNYFEVLDCIADTGRQVISGQSLGQAYGAYPSTCPND